SFAHKHDVKVYLAMNIYAFDQDFPQMMEYLKKAVETNIDAIIISDPGLLSVVRRKYPKLKIHLSTQANTLNSEAVKFWHAQGVKRIVLGREVSLKQAQKIKKAAPEVELELFIHGAMCISYSGRCLLSKHMTGRSANRGECTQPCRWEYHLKETARPNEDFGIEEDSQGTYIMNSKDLCLIEHIPKLIEAEIDSFKVEGRMKSVYYAALVTKIYRQAIDSYLKDPKNYKYASQWKEELQKVSHRRYTTGFYLRKETTEAVKSGGNVRAYTFVGTINSYDPKTHELDIDARNYFAVNDELEIIDPEVEQISKIKVVKMRTADGQSIRKAHNGYHVVAVVEGTGEVSKFSLLRRKVTV
ncbi:MAG: U32 family peptidase C-terminal domain-containing protein, partial [Candidatus Margulisbacteria bacterium]|nr:U32 family peptidase C-terminal domain-containing protein [Candidatus Margulisiibacteriota bacterium]